MYDFKLHSHINELLKIETDTAGNDKLFYTRLVANAFDIRSLYQELYRHHAAGEEAFEKLLKTIVQAYKARSGVLKERDLAKEKTGHWFLSNNITGMSLYVDRFCGNLTNLGEKLSYLERLGVNLLHLMPLFESPENESDGGYAVSNFRKINKRFGTLDDLQKVQKKLLQKDMYLMIDIVLNHASHRHEWAEKAKQGDKYYQDFFYFFDDRNLPNEYEATMPEVFPESSPGSFTFVQECNQWVMTVFHNYQWDLNFQNPLVLVEMLDIILFYANLGVDILRIDAPAFIWKQPGTTCQNLPQAHTLLRLIKQCVQVVAPGMALLGEAIVSPKEIMKYFGSGAYTAHECDFAYNATHMALQWDALATGDTRIMLAAQHEILKKPLGTSWITYTRCHDDIGLGYEDYIIGQAGYNAYEHRNFLKNYYAGIFPGSPAKGALFSFNPKTGDARISGSLASLCGLEKALLDNDESQTELAVKKIVMMQAHSFFLGGVPMLFYGDEVGYTNDYSYLKDRGKSYDNRWMHRPVFDWKKIKNIDEEGTIEQKVFSATQKLISLRKKLKMAADYSNLTWISPYNLHVAAFTRTLEKESLYCVFNFSNQKAYLTWYAFKEHGEFYSELFDHWRLEKCLLGEDHEYLVIEPYDFYLFEPVVSDNVLAIDSK